MEVWPKVGEFLLTQGWLGILILGMIAVIMDQRKEISFLRQRNSMLQDSRVTDAMGLAREVTEAISGTRGTIQALLDLTRRERG